MRVLVLGAGGMAGHVVSLYLRACGHSVTTLSARNKLDKDTIVLDVMDDKAFEKVLKDSSPDVVINCIALLVKPSEDDKAKAIYLNSYLPHYLENYYRDKSTKIIHISTDAVFSGKNKSYSEDSLCDGESFYGRTKAVGEIINNKDLTLRLSIIGPDMRSESPGLFNWFCQEDGVINGYSNVMWCGITTLELAKAINAALEQNLTGLYHLAPEKGISKYKLLLLFKDVFSRTDLTVKPIEGLALNTKLANTREDFKYTIPSYRKMAEEIKVWVDEHAELYKHYGKK